MLTLQKRSCLLGANQSSKVAVKKAVKYRLLTFELEGFILDERELNALLRDPHAWEWHYHNVEGEVVPRQSCYKAHELAEPIPLAFVGIYFHTLDGALEIHFNECKLSKIKLACTKGGDTLLSCKVTTLPILDETLPQLFGRFGEVVEVEIRGEPPGAQQDLPLATAGSEGPRPPSFWGAGRKPEGTH